jgi:hypothetical protein
MKKQRYHFVYLDIDRMSEDAILALLPSAQRQTDKVIRARITDPAERPANLGACFDFAASQGGLSSTCVDFLHETKAALARATDRDPADLPADPRALKPILAAVHPRNIFWYRNALRTVREVLIQAGWWPVTPEGASLPLEPWVEELASLEHWKAVARRSRLRNWHPQGPPH